MIEKKVDNASWKERRLVRKEWDAWVILELGRFGVMTRFRIWPDLEVWFGVDYDTGIDETMKLKC